MTDVLKELIEEFEEHKGEFVIGNQWKVLRFVGISEDEHDYSYVLYDGRELIFESPLTGLTYLKGKIDDRDYNEFERLADYNHQDRYLVNVHEFTIEEYKSDLRKYNLHETFHTDLIFNS